MKILIIYGALFMSITQILSFEECGFNKDVFQGCSDDCSGQVFCIGNHLIELDCKLQSGGEKPYCNLTDNLCQSAPVTCNSNPSDPTEFQCPDKDAYYPDPLNCTKYYECKNKVPTSAYCQLGYKFNPKLPGCQYMAKCIQFSLENGACRNKLGKYVLHPLDKNVYVKCETYPIVMRCPTGHIFDLKTEECRYDCVKKGIFPDIDNEEYYYLCEKVGLHWQPKHRKCPNEMIFDKTFAGCVLKPPSENGSIEEVTSEEPSTYAPSTTT